MFRTFIFLAVTLLVIQVSADHGLPRPDGECRDVYIWLWDGSVDCRHLEFPSFWGIHNQADYFCNTYSQTDCCETCARLRLLGRIS